mgnify:CR=1 FL=1
MNNPFSDDYCERKIHRSNPYRTRNAQKAKHRVQENWIDSKKAFPSASYSDR